MTPHDGKRRRISKRHFQGTGKAAAVILGDLVADWPGVVRIVAGHFFVVLDPIGGDLIPSCAVTRREPSWLQRLTPIERRLMTHSGDFTLRSLAAGFDLVQRAEGRDWKIMLTVDDHQFQRERDERGPPGDGVARLRRRFLHAAAIPEFAVTFCARRRVDVREVFQTNDDDSRPPSALLPSKSYLYSESVHRNRFSERFRTTSKDLPGFSSGLHGVENGLLYFEPADSESKFCLIDREGAPQCSGAMIELLLDMIRVGADGAVMFIPGTCRHEVDIAVQVAMSMHERLSNVVAAWHDGADADGRSEFTQLTHYRSG
jgi:hypothetical protein